MKHFKKAKSEKDLQTLLMGRKKGSNSSGIKPLYHRKPVSKDYESQISRATKTQTKYLILLFVCCLLLPLITELVIITNPAITTICPSFLVICYSWFGGLLGGTTFTAKHLSKNLRKTTNPYTHISKLLLNSLLSATFATIIILLIDSKLIDIDSLNVLNMKKSYALGFLAGYFSDHAIRKLAEIAELFLPNTNK